MAAHRYWRIRLRLINGGTNGAIGELQMRTSLGGSNVATGGTASASTIFNASYTATKAFDGLTSDTGAGNGWAALTMGGSEGNGSFPWLSYDFGSGNNKDIAEIVIFAPGTGGVGIAELPVQFDWQWSDDNVRWTTQRAIAIDTGASPWALSSSKVIDVRALGPVSIHNGVMGQQITAMKMIPPGRPGNLTYDPTTPEGKINVNPMQYAYDSRGGMYKLAGTTTSLGDPQPRRVRLYYQPDGRFQA